MRAIIFDLDGTLLDSLQDLADAMNAVLTARGLPTHPRDAYKGFVGDGITVLTQRALPPDCQGRVVECVAAMREEYRRRETMSTRPYPEIPELLAALRERRIPLAVLSNKPHEFTVSLVQQLLGPFELVWGMRAEFPAKPDPTSALAIAAAMGVPPGAITFVGDTSIDMQTAGAAGMTPVGVLWGFRPGEELQRAGARHLIARPLQLLDYMP
ncbi:MAG: HAD family hydrolase [Candidatus Xenobia bacterium]